MKYAIKVLHANNNQSPPPPPLQIEYHLIEIPEENNTPGAIELAPRLALMAPEILQRLEAEDAAATLLSG